jgi:hypothetical protein
VRFSYLSSGDKTDTYDCSKCDERGREFKNCHNRHRVKHPILKGKNEWIMVTSTLRPIVKVDDIKFYECPVSAISHRTWQRIRLVNETTDPEHTNILHLPFPGTFLDQPPWYRQTVQIVRQERAANRQRELDKVKR